MFTPLKREGIDKLHELCLEAELEQDANQMVSIRNVIKFLNKNKVTAQLEFWKKMR